MNITPFNVMTFGCRLKEDYFKLNFEFKVLLAPWIT